MKAGIFNYWLNYNYAKSGGYRLSGDFEPQVTGIREVPGGNSFRLLQNKGVRENSDFESNNFWAKIGIEPNEKSEYYLNFHYLNRDKAFSPPVNPAARSIRVFYDRPAFSNFARLPNYIDWGLDFDAKQKVHDKLTFKAKLFYHNHTDDYVSYSDETYSEILATSTYKDYIAGGALFADFQPVDWNILRFAVHYRNDNHQQRDDKYLPFEESASYTGSVAVENEFNLVKNLSVVAGLSYDWFDIDKSEVSELDDDGNFVAMNEETKTNAHSLNPMLGLTYTFPDATKIFGSVAHKSRFPTLSELYSSRSGNPDLEAEESWNYTVGISRPISTFAKAGLSFFYYDVRDLITNDAPHDLGTNYNLGKVALYGFEVNAEVYPIDGLTLRVDYAYEEAENRSTDRVSDDVTKIPRHKVDVGMQYIIPVAKTRIDFGMTHVGKTYSQLPTNDDPTLPVLKTTDYTLFNAKITQPIWKYFEAYAAVKNIFDKDYAPEFGYPNPGRSFWFGLTAKF
jgi:outer membrane receptor for Fe3+-dicitrate